MRIGIDCHTLEKTKTGVARYLANLLEVWKNEKSVEFVFYSTENVKNPLNIKSTALYYNFSLPQKAKKDKIDILFLPFYMRPFFCKVPTAVAIHDISYIVHPEWFDFYHRLAYGILTNRAIKKSKTIFTCSNYTKNEILKYYKINHEKIHVVPLAADEKFVSEKNNDKIQKVKNKYNLNKKYLFCAGTIFNRRHVLELIEAFKLILKIFPDYQLFISGGNATNPYQDIDKIIEKIPQIKKVDYVDEEDLLYLYQGSEIFVYLSEYEGFGLPPLEAMACGVPVLTTKMTSLGEVLGDYPVAINNPGDIHEIEGKITQILNDENLKKNMIDKGLERAKLFSWRKTAEETYKILMANHSNV
jgi:glycosyltransferase involved in cell wall biosynthesis